MRPSGSILKSGDVVAERYRLEEELGRGSYGVVFRAIQLGIEREVALKTLLPQAMEQGEEKQRFEREAKLVSRMTHPNIITLHDYGEHEGILYMVMEYVEGQSLGDLIKKEAPLPAAKVRALTYQLLDALQFAHDLGVVHRDLKPENIWLLQSNSMTTTEETVKVLDFGIAKVMQGGKEVSAMDTLTQAGFVLGTPQYMSPENITGDPVTHQADLYAVGLMIQEMLTGEHPFDAPSPNAVMVGHLRDDPPRLPPEIKAWAFQRAIDLCLKKQPHERIQTARELREVLEQDELMAEPAAGLTVSSTLEKKKSWPMAAMATVIAAAALVAAILFAKGGADTPLEEVPMDAQAPATIVTNDDPVGHEESGQPDAETQDPPIEPEMVFGDDEVEIVDEDLAKETAEEPVVAARSPGRTPSRVSPESPERAADQRRVEPVAKTDKAQTAEEAPVARIALRITSTPHNARVTLNGRPIGTTPMEHKMAPGEEKLTLGFSLIGYRDTYMNVVPSKDQAVDVRLKKGRLNLVP